MDRTIESAFFDIFKQGGIASMCVEILEVKYKLNKSLLNQIAGNSDWEEFYTKTLPNQIKQRACDLNVDFDSLFTEVGKNLSECKTNPTEFSNYCLSLLSPFVDFLRKVKPSKHRERERQMKMDNVRLLLDSGIDEDRELANDIQSRVEVMIADWENIEKEFRTISKKHTEIPTEELGKYFEGNYTETIFAELMRMLKDYAIGIDWILAQIGVDLLNLQNDGGIYLIESRNIYNYIQFAGTTKIAQRVFDALSQNGTQQQPDNETPQRNKKQPSFRSIIQYEDKEKLLNRLHFLIGGKRGADVGAILLQAKVEGYLMRTPNRAEFENEFGKLTDDENSTAKSKWEAIRKYLDSENSTAINKCSSMNIRIFGP